MLWRKSQPHLHLLLLDSTLSFVWEHACLEYKICILPFSVAGSIALDLNDLRAPVESRILLVFHRCHIVDV